MYMHKLILCSYFPKQQQQYLPSHMLFYKVTLPLIPSREMLEVATFPNPLNLK